MSKIDRPILAIGMPRSGTTWIGKILDSHPRTLYRHEPDTWQRLEDIPIFAAARPTEKEKARVRSFIESLPGMQADRVCGKRPIFDKEYASAWAVRRYAAESLAHKALARLGAGGSPPVPPQPGSGQSYRLVMKSIESLGRIGLLAQSIPEGRFLHIVRHPCGYVASVLRGEAQKRFGHNEAASDFELLGMACDTEQGRRHSLSVDHLRTLTPAQRLAWRWLIFNEKAADETAEQGNSEILYYEKLCADPVGETRRVFQFCDLEWNSQTQDFVTQSTTHSRADYYSVYKDPMESAWRWQEQMEPESIRQVMEITSRIDLTRPYLSSEHWNRSVESA